MPFMFYGEISMILEYEVPSSAGFFIVLFIFAFWIYLAMRIEFLGKLYKKVTVILPSAQLIIFTCLGVAIAHMIINSWAEEGTPTKGMAIFFAILSFIGIRLLMSLFYWIYPIAKPKHK